MSDQQRIAELEAIISEALAVEVAPLAVGPAVAVKTMRAILSRGAQDAAEPSEQEIAYNEARRAFSAWLLGRGLLSVDADALMADLESKIDMAHLLRQPGKPKDDAEEGN